jgi:hypothetical protein
MSYYQTILRPFLDANLDAILRNLGKDFDSNDFITAFRLLFPNEYATALRRSGSYRAIHTWIARWYLARQTDRLQKGDIRQRQSDNRNPTKNHTWIKL